MQGIVKKLTQKGYGFIGVDGAQGKDLFFHVNGVAKGLRFEDLHEGDRVSFDREDTPRGPAAVNVRPMDGGAAGDDAGAGDDSGSGDDDL